MSKKQLLAHTIIVLFVTSLALASDIGNTEAHTLSLSCRGADIVDVLRAIGIQHQVNIVPDNSVSGVVTIHLDKAPFEAGLRTLLETNGFTLEQKDSIYLVRKQVTTKDNLQITASDGKLTIDARGADVAEVISQLARNSLLNIVAESNLTGNITAHLTNVPMEDGLRSLFLANNFTLNEDAGIYRVGSRMARMLTWG